MANQLIFETERLILKTAGVEDAELVYKLLNSPKFLENIGDREVHSIDEAEVYIQEKMLPQMEKLGFTNFIVIRKTDGVKMGTCGLFDREGLEAVDIGFAYLPKFEGKGYGFEAAHKMMKLGFYNFGIDIICAIVNPENIPSNGLIKKLGMKFIRNLKLPKEDTVLNYYEIDKKDFS